MPVCRSFVLRTAVLRTAFVIAVVVLAGCSGSSVTAPSAATESTAEAASAGPSSEETSTTPTVGERSEDQDIGATSEVDVAESPNSVAPLAANDENAQPSGEVDSTVAWISRRSMTASSIEVVWSAPEGGVDYQVHRLDRTGDVPPSATEMTADNVIHAGAETGTFVDDEVTEGATYWYGIRGLDVDGVVLSTGWHATAAVTDEQPPAQVEVSIEQTNGSILLAWNEPEENFQMHGYRILRAVDGGEPEVAATTWTLDQRSFIDEDPPAALTTYSVVAFDFHWNESEPTEVTLDLS